ncbi:oligosaccharide flippase family protein [Methylobacterium sp. EM32]|uniref:oligosaccharide flippase family protein n=1 Tax=Methylobacterium sp. EM32 TaxID=3163481 RepID=UPI0033A9214A
MSASINASRASAWSFAARLVAQVSSLVLLLVAARSLTAVDLGIFALASATAMLISRLAEAGWTQYVMAWDDPGRPPATVFWTGLGVALLGGLAGVAGGLSFVWFGGNAPYGELLAGLALLIPLGAVTALQYGILVREGRIGTIAVVTIASDALSLVAGIGSLLAGGGVTALLISRAVMNVVALLGSLAAAGWLPRFSFDGRTSAASLRFVARLTATQIIEFVRSYGAEFVLALFLGPAEVAIYRLSSRVVGAIGELFSEPLRMLSWASLSRSRASATAAGWRPRLEGERIVFGTALLALPSFIGLSLVSGSLVQVLLGDAWQAAAPVIAILAIGRLLSLPAVVVEPMLVLVGQVRLLPIITTVASTIGLILLLVLAPYGPVGAAGAQLLSAVATLPVFIWAQTHYAEVSWQRIAQDLRAAALAVTALAVGVVAVSWKADQWHLSSWLSLTACIVVGGAIYGALIAMSYRTFCRMLMGALLRL